MTGKQKKEADRSKAKPSLKLRKLAKWAKKMKFTYFFTGLFIGMIFINKYGINFLQAWKIEYNSVLIEYLKILLSFPPILLIIVLFFSIKYSSAIDYFIRNAVIKFGGAEIGTQQEKSISANELTVSKNKKDKTIKLSKQDVQVIAKGIDELESTKKTQQQNIKQLRNLVIRLANRSEFFEFKYLSKFLVLNSQLVLRDLVKNAPITKDLLIKKIFVPKTVLTPIAERIAIYNALLVNGLINEKNSIIKVSKKGHRFLKFTGLV